MTWLTEVAIPLLYVAVPQHDEHAKHRFSRPKLIFPWNA